MPIVSSSASLEHPKEEPHGPHETLPHVGKPLDGRRYCNIIEEQIDSELPPTPEEEQPLLTRHLAENKSPDQKQPAHDLLLSVGIA